MSVSFEKTGIVKVGGGVIESPTSALVLNKTISYTPGSGAVNSCMETDILGFQEGVTYTISAVITWKGFTDLPSNFASWLQGAQHKKDTGWGWTTGAYPCSALESKMGGQLASFIKKNSSGKTSKIVANFTCPSGYDGFGVGCRCDYSNGIGSIEISGITIVPKKYYIGVDASNANQSIKIISDEVIGDDFIEY